MAVNIDLEELENSIIGSYDLCHVRASDVLAIVSELQSLRNVIDEEIEYLHGFCPDHGDYIMLLTGKSLERLEKARK